ncbi:MAG: DUF2480 family protein [Candidatus Zixiibacteriota bacterium]|nr:MAG: DUF2480 family protein [candidate division Zixibacteria bacterium]
MRSVERRDWSPFKGKRVLVRGCSSTFLPPWALMHLTAKLIPHARSIYYGNEHDNVAVYKSE